MGRAEFETIVAQASRRVMRNIGQNSSLSVAAGGTYLIEIFSPSGTISKILSKYYKASPPTGATSGTHGIRVQIGTNGPNIVEGYSAFSSNILFDHGEFQTADSAKYPATSEAQAINVSNMIVYDSITPLRIIYTNSTDVAQDLERISAFTAIEEVIG